MTIAGSWRSSLTWRHARDIRPKGAAVIRLPTSFGHLRGWAGAALLDVRAKKCGIGTFWHNLALRLPDCPAPFTRRCGAVVSQRIGNGRGRPPGDPPGRSPERGVRDQPC